LAKLGQLWDLNNLGDLGSPLALMRRIVSIVGNVPIISLTFLAAGVPAEVVANLDDPDVSVTDSAQKAMYEAMLQITGDPLSQILQVLGVTTVGITTMADLLNPVKLFPTSFQSLSVPTADGSRPIYKNSQGDINTNLIQQLPPYILSSTI
jgi:type IV secretory pathway VirB2 component (pilin)